MKQTTDHVSKNPYLLTVVLFLLFGVLVASAAYVSFIPPNIRIILKIAIPVICLAAWLVLRRNKSLQPYSQIALSFFAVSLGVLLAHYGGSLPMKILGFSLDTLKGMAMAKFGESLPIVLSILALHFAAGGSRDGLFLRGGNLKLGLIAGLAGFIAFLVISLLTVGAGLPYSTIITALPWILIFIFSNAFLEELWFRALFLKKLEPLVGAKTTLIITSLVFAGVHISSTYVVDILMFMVALMALGLLFAWLMRKTNSIWGPVLIHAGADILVMLGFLSGQKF